jgi:hypothetical protein
VQALSSCPAGFLAGSQCSSAIVTCPGTADIQVTYGVLTGAPGKGTILIHGGSGGTEPYNGMVSPLYQAAGYSLIQLAWATQWEDTGLSTKNVGMAACRPATLLSYLANDVAPSGPKCALGNSAGSAAMGYSLAWYGASTYLDKVQFSSGPVFSDISQGCQVPSPGPQTICPAGQFGCEAGDTFTDSPSYDPSSATNVGVITGDASCGSGTSSSSTSIASWKAQSIVDGTTTRTFAYPDTSLSGWICDNGENNSAAQANIYFQQFTNSSQAASFLVVPVSSCSGPEGVGSGFTPSGTDVPTAMLSDITDPVNGCVAHTH